MGFFSNLLGRGVVNALSRSFYGLTMSGGVQYLSDDVNTYVGEGYENTIVYAAVNVLLRKQVEAPLLVSRVVDDKSYTKFKSYIKDPDTPAARLATAHLRAKAFEDVTAGAYGTLYDLLKNPNAYQTSTEFWESFFLMYNLTGEAFIYVTVAAAGSKNAGRPIEMHVLPSQHVTIIYSGDHENPIRGYSFDIGTATDLEIPERQVMHLKKPNPLWGVNGEQLRGHAPLKSGRKTLTGNNLNVEARAIAAKNGGSVTLLHGDPSKGKLGVDQMNQMDDLIKEKIRGVNNYKNIIMTNGYLDAKKIGDNIVDMDLINAGKDDVQKITSLWGVNPILIGSDVNSTENNVRAAYKSLVTNVVLTDLLKRDEKFTAFVQKFYGKGEVVRTDTTVYSELAPDLELMSKIFGQPRLTENQKLELFNYGISKDPNMDKVYMPAGLVPLDQLNASAGLNANEDYI